MQQLSSREPVTIKGIAKRLGLSHATVSYVLTGKAGANRVSSKTAAKVCQEARNLNYVPNNAAQGLVRRSTKTISVLCDDLRMDWANGVLEGVNSVLEPKGYTSFVAVHRGKRQIFTKELLSACGRRDEGLLCHPNICVTEYKQFSPLVNHGIPIVFMGDIPEGWAELKEISSVIWNCGPAVKSLIQHMVKTGRRHFAFFGVKSGNDSDLRRFAAYIEALRENGLEVCQERVIWDVPDIASIGKCVKNLFVKGGKSPDAIFAMNDYLALRCLDEIESMGVNVPGDVALAGVGNLSMVQFSNRIGLTTIVEPLYEIGKKSAELILEVIQNPSRIGQKCLIDHVELKIRKTA